MRVGVILPSFERSGESSIECARQAEREGLHGVFAYDHLWPMSAPGKPAIEPFVLLGRLAVETTKLVIGTLVARIGLAPDAVVVGEQRTLAALCPNQVIAGLGTGDHLSADENAAYGIAFDDPSVRRRALESVAATLRADGIEVWIGAGSPATNRVARSTGSTLNLFGTGPEAVALEARDGPVSWAGVLPRRAGAAADRLRAVAEAGATWAVISSNTAVADVARAARAAGIELADRAE